MKIAVLKETYAGEQRVALIPATVPSLLKAGLQLVVEAGAGVSAGFSDDLYRDKGAEIVGSREEAFTADVILHVRCLGANPEAGRTDLERMRPGQVVIGMCDPLGNPDAAREVAGTGAELMALELTPRITRAQSMDVLSSMATIAGYRAVLLAATRLPKMFPLLMTAAGTLSPARAFVIGAGVAGLQAIATAQRLGAVAQAYDVRAAVRDQVESLGARFVELQLPPEDAEDKGGYAKALGEEFYEKQRQLMAKTVAESDVVITTAAIPGRQSPLLITQEAVEGMQPGSVIVDLAAERGGNCQLSQPDQEVVHNGVVVLAPTNLPSEVPRHASQMYSNNVAKFLLNMIRDGQLDLNLEDEIVRETLITRDGEVTHPRLRELLNLPPLEREQETAETSTDEGEGREPSSPPSQEA